MDGPTIDNGAIEISGDRIARIGTIHDLGRDGSGEILDLGEQILLPGLINAHCHLDYTALRGRIAPKESFTEWIRAINAAREQLSSAEYAESINTGIAEARKFGTTSIVNLEGLPDLAVQARSPLRIWWLAELIDVRAPESATGLIHAAARALKPTRRWGLAPHSPFTASESLYQQCEKIAAREDLVLSTHLAESPEELAMFQESSGPLHAFLKSIGRNMDDCGKGTPLARFLAMTNARRPNELSRWIVAHLNELPDTDIPLLKGIEPKFHVVHCPRSHRYFGHSAFPFASLRKLGFNICLGTDSLASNDSLDMFEEMRLFAELHPSVSCRDIFEMATLNPARALRHEKSLGRIGLGSHADVIAIPDQRGADVFETILQHVGPVSWIMAAGTQLSSQTQ